MAGRWIPIPIDSKLFTNVHESVLTRAHAALENSYVNEAGGHSRFPGLKDFATLGGVARVYMHEWKGDLVTVTSQGKVYRVDSGGAVTQVLGVPVSGGKRVVFTKTENELLMCAGGPIIRYAGDKTELFSKDAPNASHVAYIDGYVVANEVDSGRFQHNTVGDLRAWSALDTFAASGSPDNINALMVTPFRELLVCGPDSIEQFERLPSGDPPFFRRWSVGEGVFAPSTLVFVDNAAWAVNRKREFVRFSGQVTQPTSDDIGRSLKALDDWTDAWAEVVDAFGQKFIVLQAPFATNTHGTKGVTAAFDVRSQKWFNLYGWDLVTGLPARWPGWSCFDMWGKTLIGGEGRIWELSNDTFYHGTDVARMLGRTAPLSELGEIRIDNVRARLRRGTGTNTTEGTFSLRVNRDSKGWSNWKRKGLGLRGAGDMFVEFGGMGAGHTWQWEYEVTDNCPVELVALQAQVTALGE
jgi:hypothetical protein